MSHCKAALQCAVAAVACCWLQGGYGRAVLWWHLLCSGCNGCVWVAMAVLGLYLLCFGCICIFYRHTCESDSLQTVLSYVVGVAAKTLPRPQWLCLKSGLLQDYVIQQDLLLMIINVPGASV